MKLKPNQARGWTLESTRSAYYEELMHNIILYMAVSPFLCSCLFMTILFIVESNGDDSRIAGNLCVGAFFILLGLSILSILKSLIIKFVKG